MREERVTFSNSRGDRLAGVFHHPAGLAAGAVILCHGMESNKESEKLIALANALAGRGLLALRFDFSYVGESSGRFEDITYTGEVDDLRSAYSLSKDRQPGRIAVVGSSMGGTVGLLFAARQQSLAALVTIAAPLHPENFPRKVLTPAELARWRETGFTFYNGRRLNASLLDDVERVDVRAEVRTIACPVLILHGDADTVVPVEEAYELDSCLTGTRRLKILAGCDHRISDRADLEIVLTEALDWLAEYVH